MAFAEEVLPAALLADSTVASIVGDKVVPTGGAQGYAAPYLTFQRASTVGSNHLTGGGDLDQVRMQVSAWAKTGLAALVLAQAARDLIAPKSVTGLGTFQGQQPPTFDTDTGNWGVSADYFIWQERI
ncbi:hypothetical protein BH10PSE12_BH10PSE12_02710 [soil metagenome]